MIEEITNMVREAAKDSKNMFGYAVWTDHIDPMIEIAKSLSEKMGADTEIVEISAILHDYAGLIGEYENHHVVGAELAEEILLSYDYPLEKIKRVQHCILAHRSSKDIRCETVEAVCIADADAIAHFQAGSQLYELAAIHKLIGEQATNFVRGKLIGDWNKLSSKGKEFVRQNYDVEKALSGVLG